MLRGMSGPEVDDLVRRRPQGAVREYVRRS